MLMFQWTMEQLTSRGARDLWHLLQFAAFETSQHYKSGAYRGKVFSWLTMFCSWLSASLPEISSLINYLVKVYYKLLFFALLRFVIALV